MDVSTLRRTSSWMCGSETCAGSFAGLGYLAMYLAGKIGFFDRRGHSWKFFPLVLPLLGAAFVGISRIDNYWHHWYDVVVGSLLGKKSCCKLLKLHPILLKATFKVDKPESIQWNCVPRLKINLCISH